MSVCNEVKGRGYSHSQWQCEKVSQFVLATEVGRGATPLSHHLHLPQVWVNKICVQAACMWFEPGIFSTNGERFNHSTAVSPYCYCHSAFPFVHITIF